VADITKSDAIDKLNRELKQIDVVLQYVSASPAYKQWSRDTQTVLRRVFGDTSPRLEDFNSISYMPMMFSSSTPDSYFEDCFRTGMESARALLKSSIKEVQEYWDDKPALSKPTVNALERVERLCSRFHLVASQLRQRHGERETLEVEDEYDVQDLLHALLKVDFDDVRPEEWSPSYAGGSSRQDFLLKNEKLVVEVKKSRKGLGSKEVGEQLLIDIARYRAHPDCSVLFCLVYDPEGRVKNPRGLEADLRNAGANLEVHVFVVPT
jgi:hypothetical protein